MPVLKQHYNTPAMREAIVLDLGDIGAQASRIRAAAETQARQIIEKAQAKAEQIARQTAAEAREEGYAAGLEQGLAEGREQGYAESLAQSAEQLRQLTEAWSQVATDWEQQRTEMEREARQAVIEFALRAAEKIVHRVIEIDETVVVDQAAQALSMVLSAHDASVRMHPVDRPMLEDALPDLLKELSTLEHIELVDDETVTPGGCVVAFGQGRVDATIETQVQRLVDLILPEPPDAFDEPAAESFVDETMLQDDVPAVPHTDQLTDTDASTISPVFEITEQGLVEKGNPAMQQSNGDEPTEPIDPTDDGPIDEHPGHEA